MRNKLRMASFNGFVRIIEPGPDSTMGPFWRRFFVKGLLSPGCTGEGRLDGYRALRFFLPALLVWAGAPHLARYPEHLVMSRGAMTLSDHAELSPVLQATSAGMLPADVRQTSASGTQRTTENASGWSESVRTSSMPVRRLSEVQVLPASFQGPVRLHLFLCSLQI